MAQYYLVKFVHTDLEGWQQYVRQHVEYLYKLVAEGSLVVSGPVETEKEDVKEAYLIFNVESRDQLQTLLEADPYWYEGLVADYSVELWQPMFGDLKNLTIDDPMK